MAFGWPPNFDSQTATTHTYFLKINIKCDKRTVVEIEQLCLPILKYIKTV